MRRSMAIAWLCHAAVGCVTDGKGGPAAADDETTAANDDEDDDEDDDETTIDDPSATTDPTDDESSSDEGRPFLVEPDGGGVANECDIWAKDCPTGEKCMPWVNDGGNAWNATRCVELVDNPAQPGDPCTAEGGGASGDDDCDDGAMCWHVDEAGQGTCVAFCEGSPANPVCTDTATACSISNDVLALCLPTCDPLLQDCDIEGGEACYLNGNTLSFFCAPDVSGEGGAYGDPCDSMYINICNAGLLCRPSEEIPDCEGSTGCCTPFCPVSEGDAACPGAAGGQQCNAVYDAGQAPPDYEDVGICAIPSQ